jgi:hypothetical protein
VAVQQPQQTWRMSAYAWDDEVCCTYILWRLSGLWSHRWRESKKKKNPIPYGITGQQSESVVLYLSVCFFPLLLLRTLKIMIVQVHILYILYYWLPHSRKQFRRVYSVHM